MLGQKLFRWIQYRNTKVDNAESSIPEDNNEVTFTNKNTLTCRPSLQYEETSL